MSGWFHRDLSTENEPVFAVFLQKAAPWHTGVLYRDMRGVQWRLHLAFHHDLKRETIAPRFWQKALWVEPGELDPLTLEELAGLCELVWNRHRSGGLPYGLRYEGAHFDAHAELKQGDDEKGLTCATFVLAIFGRGTPLVDLATWPPATEEDQKWQASIVYYLEQYGADPEHVEAVRKQAGCIRVRPPEVVAACAHPLPCPHAKARASADELEAALTPGV